MQVGKISDRIGEAMAAIMLMVLCGAASVSSAGEWQVRIGDDATVEILRQGVVVVESQYVFWGPQWSWAGVDMKLGASSANGRAIVGGVQRLGVQIEGLVQAPRPNQVQLLWKIRANETLKDIVGGGLEFRLHRGSPVVDGLMEEPRLMAQQRGWSWRIKEGPAIVCEFGESLADIYFERGNKGQIRAMFAGERLEKGVHTVSMKMTLPEGAELAQTLDDRYGPEEISGWYRDALPHDKSPVDLRFLNHRPAGKFGFVKADGDRLVFENGDEARFWGGNIAAYAIFTDKEYIEAQSKRMAQLGYNLMRIHHHDSMGWVDRTVIDQGRDDSQHPDAEVMERLDYWIKCLRDEGIYVWLDLHVGRLFKEGDRIGEGFAEMMRRGKPGKGAEGKGYCYFNDRIEQLMEDFNARYLSHVNRYTGLAYKDDPAIMGLLITNENDITGHFGNLMLADKNNPYHNRIFEAAARGFAEARDLDFAQTVRTWVPGPSKLFLADREYQWNRRMLGALEALGVRVPVSTTQMWGNMPLYGLPSLTAGGIIDVHSYGEAEALSVNPRFEDNYVTYMATGQAYGKPVSITEWNVPWPAVDRFTAPLYVASISALQGWDAPMIYNYSQRDFGRPSRQGTWSTFSDAALCGVMPAAALLFRQGHVRPAREHYCVMLDKEKLYLSSSHPKNMAALRTLVERSKVSIGLPDAQELDWDEKTMVGPGVQVVEDVERDFIGNSRDAVRSDTGQLMRNWVKGYQVIDAEGTQAVHGWIGGESFDLKAVEFDVETPKAVVSVSSLDGRAIGACRKVLVTAIGRVTGSKGSATPLLSEPVKGVIRVAGPAGMQLIPLAGDGKELEAVSARYVDGRYIIRLPAVRGTHWFMLSDSD